ncbi:hypothetical protein [Amycolatopsis regifaucium]|uniref:hypothetical protein n=1 Tax=Amycolatopsis regifaucium TaxID=546365 RepID=UPI0012E72E3A|nr:hypothetical protein [Amycolatopsis regifaucium]
MDIAITSRLAGKYPFHEVFKQRVDSSSAARRVASPRPLGYAGEQALGEPGVSE